MSSGPPQRRRIDIEAEAALAALLRARQRAERIALMTGTYLIQVIDGKVVRVAPRPEVARTNEPSTDDKK